ncbi:hypothetical protein C1H46_039696 [Malus baccata]|uniref:ATP-citrate synthase citrate-binding domain-containing protein n=1 Tax=Malus baccata TaxID=106549 RepID=A0A540KKQ1_MALBA|nr:hypothetical protein C1H46_039696 [Malus baccata]
MIMTISEDVERKALQAKLDKMAKDLEEVRDKIGDFIKGVFSVFQDLDFSFLEMNPFTLVDGEPCPLDMRGELDDTAAFKNNKWGSVEFPLPFGRVLSPTETFIHSLDEKTSASLKFTVLNPKGRIWTMVAGGGASVIYADTESKLKAARMHIFVRKGGPNYQTGLAKMSALGEELGVPLEVYGPEATMTEICKQAIECIVDEA